jgi:hypothetical protein
MLVGIDTIIYNLTSATNNIRKGLAEDVLEPFLS